jgi:hypothetical protein
MATPKEGNPLWLLRSFYFMPCDLMYRKMARLKPQFMNEQTRTEAVADDFLVYLTYWLAGLFVVAEGWKELGANYPDIDNSLAEHWDSLKRFRNAVFHFQPNDRKHMQFFEVERFNWAKDLHEAWRAFFAAQDC